MPKMKKIIKKETLGLALLMIPAQVGAQLQGKSFFNLRSQGVNAARELVGWQTYINQHRTYNCGDSSLPPQHNYGSFSLTPEYTRSFRAEQLAEYFFGCQTIKFTGSRVAEREKQDILADYFGLPTDFESKVTVKPRIDTFLIDFNWYYSFNFWIEGMYVRAHVPFVHAQWDINLKECISNQGRLRHIAGYMSPVVINRDDLLVSVEEAFKGVKKFGDMREPFKFGKIDGKQSTTQLADIELAWGWNFYRGESGHAGLNMRFTAPLGTRPNGEFLFEPIVGNCHHYGLGIGFTGHYTFGQYDDKYWGIYGDANLTHLFKSEQIRSFDFKANGPGSRYMLLEELVSPAVGGLFISPDPANADVPQDGMSAQLQYNRTLVPAINQTSLKTKVRIGIQADIVLKLSYQRERWGFDLGYNLWVRSKEKLSRKERFESDRWAIKGDVQVYGDDFTNFGLGSLIPLNATQSMATLNAGAGDGNANQQFLNFNADSIGAAQRVDFNPDEPGLLLLVQAIQANLIPGVEKGFVNGSQRPVLLRDCDIDTNSAVAPSSLSNKLFVHISYSKDPQVCLMNGADWIPFVGVGGEVEIGQVNDKRASLSQWGIWLKTGVSF